MGSDFDVIILGAGPACCSAATPNPVLTLNALKSMKEKGGDLVVKPEPADAGKVLIYVSDTGVVLREGNQEHIFFNAFLAIEPQGTGMGRAISRLIAESHNGRLSARGNAGADATFFVELPPHVGGLA